MTMRRARPSSCSGRFRTRCRPTTSAAAAGAGGEVGIRIQAARIRVGIEAEGEDWSVAVAAANEAVQLVPRLAPRHAGMPEQARMIGGSSGLASDAAAAALHAGHPGL